MPVCNKCGTNYSFWKKACPNCAKEIEVLSSATPVQSAEIQDTYLPQDPGNSYEQGMQLFQQEQYSEALACFQQALRQYTQSFTIWTIYSRTLIKLEQFQEGLRAAEQALALNPNFAEAWFRKAYALDGLKRHREAIAALDKTLLLNPGNTYARYLKGRICSASKNIRKLWQNITLYCKWNQTLQNF